MINKASDKWFIIPCIHIVIGGIFFYLLLISMQHHRIENTCLYAGGIAVTMSSLFVYIFVFLGEEDERIDKLYHSHDVFNRAYKKYYTLPNTSETLIETLKKMDLIATGIIRKITEDRQKLELANDFIDCQEEAAYLMQSLYDVSEIQITEMEYIKTEIIEKLHQLEAEYETQYLKIFKSDFQDMQIKIHEMNSL